MKNIGLYQKVFGLLYLQPLYIYRLLISPHFTENDKIFRLIFDLYIKSSGSPTKNLTYQMGICLMMLKHEKYALIENDLTGPVFDLYSIKILSLLYSCNPIISDYYTNLKKELLKVLLDLYAHSGRRGDSKHSEDSGMNQGSKRLLSIDSELDHLRIKKIKAFVGTM
jgi:hypothetical protein